MVWNANKSPRYDACLRASLADPGSTPSSNMVAPLNALSPTVAGRSGGRFMYVRHAERSDSLITAPAATTVFRLLY